MTHIIDLQPLWARPPTGIGTKLRPDLPLNARVVSVMILAHRDPSLLPALAAILKQPFLRELIVINSESSPTLEKSLAQFLRKQPHSFLVNSSKKAGLAAAFNYGARYASGDYYLFLHGHQLLSPDALFHLLHTGIYKPSPWIIGTRDESVGALPEVSLMGGGYHSAHIAPECVFLSKNSYVELQGLDRHCFHTTFHKDLCLRAHIAGGGVYQTKEQLLLAPTAAPIVEETLRKKWQGWRGRLYFFNKMRKIK